ncbi:MAG TPA: hypothetical protein DDW65_09420 [Firmicutes bacterium]|jgi:hypothetical protein|nr:hypothetical protein [Bacillota bacterium]
MKRFMILVLSVVALTLILSGCGSGGGGGDTKSLTVTFHFQASNDGNSPISGVKLGYTAPAPDTTQYTSPASGSNGEFVVKLTKAGNYIVNTVYYGTNTYNLEDYDATFTVPVDQADITANKKVMETVPIDLSQSPPSIGEIVETTL